MSTVATVKDRLAELRTQRGISQGVAPVVSPHKVIRYSRGKDKFDNQPEQREVANFDEFEREVLSDRSDSKGKIYIAAPMSIGAHDKPLEHPGDRPWRLSSHCGPRIWIGFDVDRVLSPEVASCVFAILERYRGFGYYTSSSTPENPRFRFILEGGRGMNRAEAGAVCEVIQAEIEAHIKQELGLEGAIDFDRSVYRGEQPIYTPVGNAESFSWHGRPVDVDAVLNTSKTEAIGHGTSRLPAFASMFDFERLGGSSEFPPASAHEVANECAQVARMRDARGAIPEPEWRNNIGVIKHCVEGNALCHDWSKGDPRYDYYETQKKIDNWMTGPTKCETFAKENGLCRGCKHQGDITSPIELGTKNAQDGLSEPDSGSNLPAKPDGIVNALKRSGLELGVEENGETHLLAKVGNTPTAMPLEGSEAMDSMTVAVRALTGKTPSPETLKRETAILRVNARASGKTFKKHRRTAPITDGYAINLANRAGQAVFVTPGAWEVRQNEDIYFANGGGIGEMPMPLRPTDVASAIRTLNDAWEFLGIPSDRRLILTVALVNALRTGVPYVVIEIIGSAGSGKSSVSNILAQLIDPTASGKPTDTALSVEHLAAVSQVRQVVAIDNASRVSADEQDLCCKAVYGFVVGVRKLYSNADVMMIPLHIQIIVNGITPLITRGDLLDRSLRVEISRRDSYISEEELRAWFTENHPRLFGALLELLAAGLEKLPGVRIQRQWRHRMVDFAQLGESIAQAANMGPGVFVEQLDEMRRHTASEIVTGDPITESVIKAITKMSQLAAESESYPAWRKWEKQGWFAVKKDGAVHVGAKASAIRTAIDSFPAAHPRKDWWPDSDRAMRGALLRIQPILRDLGIACNQKDVNGGKTCWVFIWSPEGAES